MACRTADVTSSDCLRPSATAVRIQSPTVSSPRSAPTGIRTASSVRLENCVLIFFFFFLKSCFVEVLFQETSNWEDFSEWRLEFQSCGVSFDGGAFFEHNGHPLCEQHYHETRGSICHQCRGPISGRCVAAMGKKFHPEHFRCSYCNRQLTKGTFKEVDRRPFCHKCYNNTFALTPA